MAYEAPVQTGAPTPSPQPIPVGSEQWLKEIAAAEEELKHFHEQGRRINDRFLDKRTNAEGNSKKKLNLFTTNVQILMSTLYARLPQPLVTREFEDEDDDVARVAALIIERNLKMKKRGDFNTAVKQCVQDRLVPGIGQVWLRYEPLMVTEQQPPVFDQLTGQQIHPGGPMERLVDETIATDYVAWEDFIWSPARVWEEVRWVGRKCKMVKEDAVRRFGQVVADVLQYQKGMVGTPGNGDDRNTNYAVHYCVVYEIWDKRSRKVYFVSKGVPTCCDVKDDPFKMDNFWPCPRPMRALSGTSSTVPRADYLMIQDQYLELDDVNDRIAQLENAVKVVGVFDKTVPEMARVLDTDSGNTMIPAASFAQFSEKGGFKGMVDWLPIDQVVMAIEKLREYRQDLIAQIYEMTGISDIMRGATKASETLGAQQLKAQYGSVRLQFLQMEVAEFVEETLQIKSEMQRKLFQPQTMLVRSNIDKVKGSAEYAQEAMALLKDPTIEFRVEVHADSMAVPEFNSERDARLGYLRAIAEFLTGAMPLIQQQPAAGPHLLSLLSWAAASFRTGRTVEGILDQAIAAANQALANPPPPPPPSPEEKLKTAQAIKTVAEAEQTTVETTNLIAHPPGPDDKPKDPIPKPAK